MLPLVKYSDTTQTFNSVRVVFFLLIILLLSFTIHSVQALLSVVFLFVLCYLNKSVLVQSVLYVLLPFYNCAFADF